MLELTQSEVVRGNYFGSDEFHNIVGRKQEAGSSRQQKCVLPTAYCLLAFRLPRASCRQRAAPLGIYQIDGRLRIRNIQQVYWHTCVHLLQKLRNLRFDVGEIVERDGDGVHPPEAGIADTGTRFQNEENRSDQRSHD